jgi:hypothetical protein
VTTTAFSTRFCANAVRLALAGLRRAALGVFLATLLPLGAWAQSSIELRSIRLEQSSEGLVLSAGMAIELAPSVEEALLKGVPITFVAEAQVLRDRWYWYDKSVTTSQRSMRLSYQPLTRRWRLSMGAGASDFSSGASLSQSFEQLAEALQAVGRLSSWRIAEAAEIESDARHNVSFRFRLDTNQLPRPMQIGIAGNPDWNVSVQRNLRPEPR